MNLKEIRKYMNDINGRIAAPQVFKVIEMLVEHLEQKEKSKIYFNLNPAQSAMAIEYRTRRMAIESLDKEIINSTACDCTSINPLKTPVLAKELKDCEWKEKKIENNHLFCIECGQPINQCDCWEDESENLNLMSEIKLRKVARMNDLSYKSYRIKGELRLDYIMRLRELILNHFYPEEESKFVRFQDWEVGKEYKTTQSSYIRNHYFIDQFGKVFYYVNNIYHTMFINSTTLSYIELMEYQWEEVETFIKAKEN